MRFCKSAIESLRTSQRFQQILIVRGFVDVLMEATVERHQSQEVVAFLGKLLLQLIEHRDLAFGRMLGGKPRRGALENFPHGVEVEDLLVRQLRDRKSAAGANDKQAPLLQPLQRFANRSAAHAKTLGNVFFANAFAAGETPFPDGVTQTLIDKIRPRSGVE